MLIYTHTGMLNIYLAFKFNFYELKVKYFLGILRMIIKVTLEYTQYTGSSSYDDVGMLGKQQLR
jgi:hypothetical protein